jgi:hypothetical protein
MVKIFTSRRMGKFSLEKSNLNQMAYTGWSHVYLVEKEALDPCSELLEQGSTRQRVEKLVGI